LQSAMSLQRISTKKSSPFSWKLPPEGTIISYSVEGWLPKRIKSRKTHIEISWHKNLIWDGIYYWFKMLVFFKKKSIYSKKTSIFLTIRIYYKWQNSFIIIVISPKLLFAPEFRSIQTQGLMNVWIALFNSITLLKNRQVDSRKKSNSFTNK
jgi:hypothetical protein